MKINEEKEENSKDKKDMEEKKLENDLKEIEGWPQLSDPHQKGIDIDKDKQHDFVGDFLFVIFVIAMITGVIMVVMFINSCSNMPG